MKIYIFLSSYQPLLQQMFSVWLIQLLVILLTTSSFQAQLFLPPSINNLPAIEPLSDPFIDEFEFGGVDQESEDETTISYPVAETFADYRLVSPPSLFLDYMSATSLIREASKQKKR